MTAPIPSAVEVSFNVDDLDAVIERNGWAEPILATKAAWRAFRGVNGVVVSVTALAATHQNCSWLDPRFFVADGLNSSPPPTWVPEAPAWFWAVVACMAAEHEATAATVGARA